MIVFECPSCKKSLQVADEHAGKSSVCPQCQHVAAVPVMAEAAAEGITATPPPASLANAVTTADNADRPKRRDRDRDLPPAKSGSGVVLMVLGVVAVAGCCVVGPIMVALLVPAVQKVREAAARTESINHLKEIGLGGHSFHDANKHMPFNGTNAVSGGVTFNVNPQQSSARSGSWAWQLLPYINHQALYNIAGPSTANTPIICYQCPGRGRPGTVNSPTQIAALAAAPGTASFSISPSPTSDFLINPYLNDAVGGNPAAPNAKRTLVGITDGSSNTIFFGHGQIHPGDYSVQTPLGSAPGVPQDYIDTCLVGGTTVTALPITAAPFRRDDAVTTLKSGQRGWGGPFPQGGLMCMGDGTVRMFPYSIPAGAVVNGVGNQNTLGQFMTPSGNEAVALPD
jgi:hypothetical protein